MSISSTLGAPRADTEAGMIDRPGICEGRTTRRSWRGPQEFVGAGETLAARHDEAPTRRIPAGRDDQQHFLADGRQSPVAKLIGGSGFTGPPPFWLAIAEDLWRGKGVDKEEEGVRSVTW